VGAILEGPVDNNFNFCSGTLIGCRTFLTAAHCLCANLQYCDDHDVSTGFVYFMNGGVYGVSAVHIHPDFYFPTADVAVVTLSEPVTGITPSKLNDVGPVPFGTRGTIVGYGYGDIGWQGIKRFGRMETTPCEAFYSDNESVCWKFNEPFGEPGEDSNLCKGDSGGPLFVDMAAPGEPPNVVVAGIASGGTLPQCSDAELSADADVNRYIQFIRDVAGDDIGTQSCGDMPPVGTPETIAESAFGTLDLLDSNALHEFHVPPDVDRLRITMNASDINLQQFTLHVNHGTPDESSEADCVHENYSTHAICEFENPEAGTWYAKVRAVESAGEYQVTATMFGNRPNSDKAQVSIDPLVDSVAPGGVLPYTVEIRNVTNETLSTSANWRIKSPNGNEYPYGPIPLTLAPGQAWTHTGRVAFSLVGPMGPGWMSIEATGTDGSFDRDWTAYTMQNEHAVAVQLSSPESLVRPGDEWPYTVQLQNILGQPLRASATWKVTDPTGHESTYGPFTIGLAVGQTWRRDLALGYFPQGPVGTWKVKIETTAQGFVDQDSLEVDLLPYGVAQVRRIEGVADAAGMSSDGRIVVGNLPSGGGGYLWTEETGPVSLGFGSEAEAVSDDGSVVMGHLRLPTAVGQLDFAARWTEQLGWVPLPSVNNNYATCGSSWTHAYDMTPDGSAIVGLTWDDGCKGVAFRWSEQTGTVLLPREYRARANAISDDGMVVGGFDQNPSYGIRRGALWVANDPSDPHTSFTESIVPSLWEEDPLNGPGELLSMTPDAKFFGGDSHMGRQGEPNCYIPGGYRWERSSNNFSDIFGPRPCWAAYPLAFSADGRIAVGSAGPYSAPVREAMIWTRESGLMLLEDLVRALGGTMEGFSYFGPALDVSSDGKKIVGFSTGLGGGAWIVTLPDAEAPALASRAGEGEAVVEGGVPVFLPVGTRITLPRPGTEPSAAGTVQIQGK
jgi:uncharacterized membrane protein